jgi:creatinine amidohydrolase
MRRTFAGALVALVGMVPHAQTDRARGVSLANLTWIEAEAALTANSIVVIPLGMAALEHGPHLKLNNNERLANYLASRVVAAAAVSVAPTMTYHFTPAFSDYPGSVSLTRRTATDMTVQIVRSYAHYGPRRFYVLNTGSATVDSLAAAATALANEGILLTYTNDTRVFSGRTHADENETSMMLFVDPAAVDMKKAIAEFGSGTAGPMTRQRDAPGVYSASGVLGDATLATRQKGEALVESLLSTALEDIDTLRTSPLPAARPTVPPSAAAGRPVGRGNENVPPNGCTPGDERIIREIGVRFSVYWRQMDAEAISILFAGAGDIRHPDGTIERGRTIIKENRRALFAQRDYRGSVHPVTLNDIRCLGPNHAIADGKWELRLADIPELGRAAAASRTFAGWCTLVLSGGGGNPWMIEAWRYTVDPPNGAPAPTTFKQPGFLGRHDH